MTMDIQFPLAQAIAVLAMHLRPDRAAEQVEVKTVSGINRKSVEAIKGVGSCPDLLMRVLISKKLILGKIMDKL